ncbi:hypothetical protein HMPREF0766_14457 [Sphingobacterium spiritivorum ATCC 33861]|uniref:Uncharacterized protein n=1 Tax=Sphingobacterium spiritivorum ATCC 33861 TaxID=525373 RepID=D7VTY7_SPHSI|nr:hypothetical protein HMPREF0766_14457 [Sphingobacterium spiritivorum ATCC 33861]
MNQNNTYLTNVMLVLEHVFYIKQMKREVIAEYPKNAPLYPTCFQFFSKISRFLPLFQAKK